ncbi:MAG: methyl-accepting chemotaxis protein, partial [Candidatus Azotimanducaceae bacterium]
MEQQMNNFSIQYRFLLVALLPTIGVGALIISAMTGGMSSAAIGTAIVTTLIAWGLAFVSMNQLSAGLKGLQYVVNRLANDEPISDRLASAGGVFDSLMLSMLNLHASLSRKTTDEPAATTVDNDQVRLLQALEIADSSIMVADAQMNIVYVNNATVSILQDAENDIRTELPAFNAQSLVGTNVDIFNKSAANQRGMFEGLKATFNTQITVGGRTFSLIATPIFGDSNASIGTVVEWNDTTEALKIQAEKEAEADGLSRVSKALRVCKANVMMADEDLNITYMNDSVKAMMSARERELQTALPNFRVSSLIGTCIDAFHANPAHQRGMLANLKGVYETDLNIAGLTFQLIATPVFGDDGSRVGTVVEWNDTTEALKLQTEQQEEAAGLSRVAAALRVCNANVMMADIDLNITYLNESVTEMMAAHERELQTALPNFSAANLVGTSIDQLHSDPAHQRGLLTNLKGIHKSELNISGLTFQLIATPVFSDDGDRVGTVVEWNDTTEALKLQTEQQEEAAGLSRVAAALRVCNASVMMADVDLNITYMNESVTAMMGAREREIQTALPNFRVSNLVGTCIDDFHANPAHQRGLLANLKGVYETDLNIAGLTFHLTATPVFADDGSRVGTVVEWNDRTEALKFEVEQQEEAAGLSRVSKALSVCNANVMMADVDLNITYMNESIKAMMSARERELQTALPNFSAANLVGTSVNQLHSDPAHQRGLLTNLKGIHKSDLNISGLTFQLIATPVFGDDGDRVGTVLEWNDTTEALKLALEQQEEAAGLSRVASALRVCKANVMMVDEDLNITYMNESLGDMFIRRERELQSILPNFKVSKLKGTCIDEFHVNPAHQRGLLAGLTTVFETDVNLASLTFHLTMTPVLGDDGDRVGTVVEWNDRTDSLALEIKERAIADANMRVRQALDNVGTATMIADVDLNVIYMNRSVDRLMKKAETDFRRDLPNFDGNKVMGGSMDALHKEPSEQRGMLTNLKGTNTSPINLGGRSLVLTASSIEDDEGVRLGTVVEWLDRTGEVAIENEINNLVEAANLGDFTQRVEESGKKGFFLNLSKGLNSVVRNVNTALKDVLDVMDSMSDGNLTNKIDNDYEGIFDQMKDSTNTTIDKLTEVITNIRASSMSVKTGASEIASGNADLSQRTEEQASSLEETASSMEEMTSVVKQSADNANSANTLAQNAKIKATEGGLVVSKAIVAMDAINKSSSEIADIIGVIEEIAFQTNLLALNAAVEAARAGEQGRGFAVVAGEVRNLAQRSADASKQIKDLIRDSESKVAEGSTLVNESGKTLGQIEQAVSEVSAMIADITSAAQEQTSGIEQVNTAVSQMDEMTQQNAALVEEATAASQAVAEQATHMATMMEFFRTDSSAP